MSEENAFDSLLKIPWGLKYKKALSLCKEDQRLEVAESKKNSSIQVRGKCEGNEFEAWLVFFGLFKKLKQINISMILKDLEEKESDQTQMLIDKFLQTYYILVEELGKADSKSGMSLEQFKDVEYLGGTSLEELPYFKWNKGNNLIKHRFIEKEGFAISTTLEPKK